MNALDDEVFATPVPSGGQLLVRTRSALDAFGAPAQRGSSRRLSAEDAGCMI